jgi:hypothetical protein
MPPRIRGCSLRDLFEYEPRFLHTSHSMSQGVIITAISPVCCHLLTVFWPLLVAGRRRMPEPSDFYRLPVKWRFWSTWLSPYLPKDPVPKCPPPSPLQQEWCRTCLACCVVYTARKCAAHFLRCPTDCVGLERPGPCPAELCSGGHGTCCGV